MPNRDFEAFKKEFIQRQEQFGLNGYQVYFKHEPSDDSFASIDTNLGDMVATVRLNSELPGKEKPHKDIKQSAKHEAIHLLVNRLQINAISRFSTEAEIYEATEELVHKLEKLIP